MPKGSASGLSAIARQRLKANDTSKPSLEQAVAETPLKTTKRRNQADGDGVFVRSKRLQRRESPIVDSDLKSKTSDDAKTDFANSFEGLAGHGDATNASGRVEELSNRRLKLLVAKGKKIFVTGICSLWLKTGTVAVYGAVIAASEKVHFLCVPTSHSIPTIEILSDSAEVELSCCNEGLLDLARFQARNIWDLPVPSTANVKSSFHVLGYHFQMPPEVASQIELDVSDWQTPLSQLCQVGSTSIIQPPRYMVTGKRSSGLASFVRCLINRLLTVRTASGDFKKSAVLLIDLGFEHPETLPPGMLGLSRVRHFLLGPPFTHPFPAFEVVKMHFSSITRNRPLSKQFVDQVLDLVHVAKKQPEDDIPLIIKIPAWMGAAASDFLDKIWKAVGVTGFVQMEGPLNHVLDSVALPNDSLRYRVPSKSVDSKVSSIADQELSMQSYFHKTRIESPVQWDDTPLTTVANARKMLKFQHIGGNLAAVLLLDQLVAAEDTIDAILGSICALILIRQQYFEAHLQKHVDRLFGSLPRIPSAHLDLFQASHSECLGLAYITEIDTTSEVVVLDTPIPLSRLTFIQDHLLVIVRPSRKQCPYYSANWIAKERETLIS